MCIKNERLCIENATASNQISKTCRRLIDQEPSTASITIILILILVILIVATASDLSATHPWESSCGQGCGCSCAAPPAGSGTAVDDSQLSDGLCKIHHL